MSDNGDSRLHFGVDKDLVNQRSRHDPLITEEVKMGGRMVPIRPRVASDARLREGFTTDQEMAYDAIAKAYSMIVAGLGQHATDYSASRGAALSGDGHGAAVMASYWEWRDTCRQRYVSAGMAVDIIIFGMTLRQCDAKHKMATGTSRKNLDKSLNLWSELSGSDRIIPEAEKGFFAKIKARYFP